MEMIFTSPFPVILLVRLQIHIHPVIQMVRFPQSDQMKCREYLVDINLVNSNELETTSAAKCRLVHLIDCP